ALQEAWTSQELYGQLKKTQGVPKQNRRRGRCNWCVYQEWIAKGFKEKVPPAA
ncbi:unnamed protein product, partial [Mesorhabditis spiculigera]